MPDLSKKFSIHVSSSSFSSIFFLPDLLCTVIRSLNFLTRVPVTSIFFSRLDRSDFSVLWTLLLKMLKTWLVLLLRLTFQVWLVMLWHLFLKRYSLTRAASFFLKTSYFFGSRYFLLSLSVYFLAASLALYRSPLLWRLALQ